MKVSEMADEEKQQRTPPALARTRQLVERSATDLKLAHDAALGARLPFAQLSKIKRASREVKDLLRDLGAQNSPHEQADVRHDGVSER